MAFPCSMRYRYDVPSVIAVLKKTNWKIKGPEAAETKSNTPLPRTKAMRLKRQVTRRGTILEVA